MPFSIMQANVVHSRCFCVCALYLNYTVVTDEVSDLFHVIVEPTHRQITGCCTAFTVTIAEKTRECYVDYCGLKFKFVVINLDENCIEYCHVMRLKT